MSVAEPERKSRIIIHGARCVLGPEESIEASVAIADGFISRIGGSAATSNASRLDLGGFLLMPGLINAHDHLEFALFPRLGAPLYRNYVEWGEDIHKKFPEAIARHRAVPKDIRVWWGGLRNLLSGVTTVSHHNPLRRVMLMDEFPVRVVHDYGWAHSLRLGGDLVAARAATPQGRAFIVHACEGVDEQSRRELRGLDELGLLDAQAVLVHGLAIDADGVALLRRRGVSLILCPSSNKFLFGRFPDMALVGEIDNVCLGSDSPLTAEGDLMDELRFAVRIVNLSPAVAYRMVTAVPAAVLRLKHGEGSLQEGAAADLVALRDTGHDFTERIGSLSFRDIECVMIGGGVRLASEEILSRLPSSAKQGMEPLSVDGEIRWLRAPVGQLLGKAEEVLGKGQVRLGGKTVCTPAHLATEYAC